MSAHDAVITGATVTTARVTIGRTIVRITAPTIVRIMATEGILIIARTIGLPIIGPIRIMDTAMAVRASTARASASVSAGNSHAIAKTKQALERAPVFI